MPTAHTIKRLRELYAQGCSLQEIVRVTHMSTPIVKSVLTNPTNSPFDKPQPPEFIEPPHVDQDNHPEPDEWADATSKEQR